MTNKPAANIPQPILTAAVGLLQPFMPNITPAALAEALDKAGQPPEAAAKIEKPLTRKEAAALLGVHITTLNRYIQTGILPSVKIGPRAVRIAPANVRALLGA